jgi:hypothetical protein
VWKDAYFRVRKLESNERKARMMQSVAVGNDANLGERERWDDVSHREIHKMQVALSHYDWPIHTLASTAPDHHHLLTSSTSVV